MTKAEFSAAVEKMRAVKGGEVTVHDWPTAASRRAYRYAALCITAEEPADVPARAADMAGFAVEVRGYLTMNTYDHTRSVSIQVSISRDLDPEEVIQKTWPEDRGPDVVPAEAA